jgi:hypothetical protein
MPLSEAVASAFSQTSIDPVLTHEVIRAESIYNARALHCVARTF